MTAEFPPHVKHQGKCFISTISSSSLVGSLLSPHTLVWSRSQQNRLDFGTWNQGFHQGRGKGKQKKKERERERDPKVKVTNFTDPMNVALEALEEVRVQIPALPHRSLLTQAFLLSTNID